VDLYKKFIPGVSVILPTFNRAYILERAVLSVIDQTFREWELLIIDDGSFDDTYELSRKFTDKFKNIRYLFHSNRGLPISLNTGIKLALGKYVTFLGSDDKYLPEHLKLRYDMLENSAELDLLHGGVKIIGDSYVKDKNDLTKMVHINECTVGGTFFGKRSIFENLSGFKDIEYSEDSDFFERAEKAGFKIKKVDFPTYIYYRDSGDSICNNI
jgi:glycosyltransferase involved in cell wall biosynthesis